ncbi:branched-chain amino acid ABC transporter permease [Siculibacillus lacustris]|uniref:Branched-chain amino acid ABC transporter permease n=1 Tax=Siculibacillus lacustris TaxID=1549641 RepID=A0A4Q9VQ73_9HYPH|nr:branched-chain amino acid ABC transporter permease [Siculibacillus lacustris]TBW36996.1 branched-chain amino acid ABC transporter permease [Siculibacillus lacustris]
MSFTLLAVQILNGLQLGVILFLVAAGLTLVFGVMDFVNLAHGVQYMLGAYLTAVAVAATGHFGLGLAAGLVGSLALGFAFEVLLFRHLTRRDHLEQVLATFAVILIVTDLVRMIFGPAPLPLRLPELFTGSIRMMPGLAYPIWRLVVIGAGLAVAFLLWVLITRTRTGMLLRAGSTHPEMVSALGVDIDRVFLFVFAFGAMLAGFAGAMAGPILSIEPAMGDNVLILAFVVIVIGGIGAVRGALVASLIVGLVDTLGRAFATDLLRLVVDRSAAAQAGPAIASMAIYVFMAAVLIFKPTGLFTGERAWTRTR